MPSQALKCISSRNDSVGVDCAEGASSCMVETDYDTIKGPIATSYSCSNSAKIACVGDSASEKNTCYCDSKDNCNEVTFCNCGMTRYASLAETIEYNLASAGIEVLKCRLLQTDTIGITTCPPGLNFTCSVTTYAPLTDTDKFTTLYGCGYNKETASCVYDARLEMSTCYCNKNICNDIARCDCATTISASIAKNEEYTEAEAEAAKVENEKAAAAKLEENAKAKAEAEAAEVETEKAAAAKLEGEKSGAQIIKAATTAAAVAAVAWWLL
jgi:hypothetical protein